MIKFPFSSYWRGFFLGQLFRLSLLAFFLLPAHVRQKKKELKHAVPSGLQSRTHIKVFGKLKISVS